MLVKAYELSAIRWVSSGDLTCRLMTTVNSSVLCTLKLLRQLILNILTIYTYTDSYFYQVMDMLTNVTVVIIHNIYVSVSNRYIVPFKYWVTQYCLSIISQKSQKRLHFPMYPSFKCLQWFHIIYILKSKILCLASKIFNTFSQSYLWLPLIDSSAYRISMFFVWIPPKILFL